jgi:hypothetical protein
MAKMADYKDYYKILGVEKDASADDLKFAYRRRARQHHPDLGGDEERFKDINEAYGVLSDDQRRVAYDRGGCAEVEALRRRRNKGGISGGLEGSRMTLNEALKFCSQVFGEMASRAREVRQGKEPVGFAIPKDDLPLLAAMVEFRLRKGGIPGCETENYRIEDTGGGYKVNVRLAHWQDRGKEIRLGKGDEVDPDTFMYVRDVARYRGIKVPEGFDEYLAALNRMAVEIVRHDSATVGDLDVVEKYARNRQTRARFGEPLIIGWEDIELNRECCNGDLAMTYKGREIGYRIVEVDNSRGRRV